METEYRPRRSMSLEQSLPSSSDTQYQTPRAPTSRFSSFGSPSNSTPLTTSPPLLNGQTGPNGTFGEDDNQYDPQHITPNLHASLVSKILGLQQELESKRAYIEDVESSLSFARAEVDSLKESQKRVGKEKQALKRQVQLHEQNALSTVEVLTEERDQSKDANVELRKKLETSQKRVRTQEEDAIRMRSALEQEITSAASNKRTLERRAELAETRLQSVIEDLAASQTASAELSQSRGNNSRPASSAANRSLAASPELKRVSHRPNNHSLNSLYEPKPSLADELHFDDSPIESSSDDEPVHTPPRKTTNRVSRDVVTGTRMHSEHQSVESSPQNMRKNRNNDAQENTPSSVTQERIATRIDERRSKVLGMVSAFEQQSTRDSPGTNESRRSSRASRSLSQSTRMTEPSGKSSIDTRSDSLVNQDAGEHAHPRQMFYAPGEDQDQLEPFPTPKEERKSRTLDQMPRLPRSRANTDLIPMLQKTPEQKRHLLLTASATSLGLRIDELDALEARKPSAPAVPVPVSSGTQTELTAPTRLSRATQTEDLQITPKIAPPTRAPPPPPAQSAFVPAVAVHPPESLVSSSSPRRPGAPSYRSKSTGVQTSAFGTASMKSTAMQTEAIRIDKRPVKLPAHLLPSALDEREQPKPVQPTKVVAPVSKARRVEPLKLEKAADFGLDRNLSPQLPPLEEGEDEFAQSDDRRASTIRSSKSIASPVSFNRPESPTYDQTQADEMDDPYPSDTEYASKTSAPRSSFVSSRSHRQFEPPAPVPEDEKVVIPPSSKSSFDRRPLRVPPIPHSTWQSSSRMPFHSRDGSMRSRSPSFGSVASSSNYSKASGPRPPFAIPARGSSREQYAKIRIQRGRQSPSDARRSGRSSPTKSVKGSQRLQKRPISQKGLRKARSEAAIESAHASTPMISLPPLPTTSVHVHGPPVQSSFSAGNSVRELQRQGDQGQNLQPVRNSMLSPTGGASVGSAIQHDVEEAVAAASIGEWMFKYMRSRKTFGKAELGKTNESRHKRWVWILPYERAVVWSNKKPTTPQALMGKAGKKLFIKSVIDIKDDTAPPKEAQKTGIFDHSIVILSVGHAALKVTAMNKDRHYMWVTALSYVAHQSTRNIQNMPKVAIQQPLPPPPSLNGAAASTGSSGRSRASSFRNHLRSGRSKVSSAQSSGVATPVVAQHPDANVRRDAFSKPTVPDSAFVPAIPRVPHSRKRSLTGPSRGRSGGMSSALCGYNTPTSYHTSTLAPGNSSVRMPSVSASSRPSMHTKHEDESVAADSDIVERDTRTLKHLPDPSPRPSEGADFGGNTNFFDAVGVVRMSAFSRTSASSRGTAPRPSIGSNYPISAPSAIPATRERSYSPGHTRQESSGSFIGPPDIDKARARGPAGNGLKGEAWREF